MMTLWIKSCSFYTQDNLGEFSQSSSLAAPWSLTFCASFDPGERPSEVLALLFLKPVLIHSYSFWWPPSNLIVERKQWFLSFSKTGLGGNKWWVEKKAKGNTCYFLEPLHHKCKQEVWVLRFKVWGGGMDDVKLKKLPRRKAKATELQANALVTFTLCHLMKHQWSSLGQLIDSSLFAQGEDGTPGVDGFRFLWSQRPNSEDISQRSKKAAHQLSLHDLPACSSSHGQWPSHDHRAFFCHVCVWDFVQVYCSLDQLTWCPLALALNGFGSKPRPLLHFNHSSCRPLLSLRCTHNHT